MERKIEIPDFRENDEATMEDADAPAPTLSSSEGSEEWEKISEDWVSLFLDPALLDDQSRSLESYSQFDTTNDHYPSQDLLADSLLLHSTDDHLSNGDLALGSASNVVEDLFGKMDSSSPGEGDLLHPKRESTGATSSTSSLTQVSGGSSSGMDVDKEGSPDSSIVLKREFNGEVSSGTDSPTFGGESECATNACSPSKEGETGSGREAGIPAQSEAFGVRHLQSIGNAIKVGLLGRSGDDRKESNKSEICEAESFGLQNQEVLEDQQSDHSDAERKGEGGDEDDEKRRARLMRNRESAQLSRQRKKVYVDELESKLRTMTATVAELNATISHLTAENVNLRRQLGYYYPAPGVCPPRPGMPMHVLPMGPYPGMVAGRPMYPGGQMPPVPIPRIKTQTPARSSKRAKSGTTKEGGDKKRTKLKAAGAASMAVMGLLCVAMVFGSFDHGLNSTTGVDDTLRGGNVRVGGRVLTSWNESANPLNNSGFSKWDYGPGWAPLEPGEHGPEREGVPSAHTRPATENPAENPGTSKTGINSSIDGNGTLATSSSPNYFSSVKTPLLIGSNVVPANTSQSFAASVFIPGANGLVKVDGNLIIHAVMAGDKAAKKQSEKKQKCGSKKKQVGASAVKKLSVNGQDNLASRKSRVVKNATTGPFVTARPLPGKVKSVVETSNPVSPVLRAGSLQQWMLGGLHGIKPELTLSNSTSPATAMCVPGPEIDFVARGLIKMLKSQPPAELPVDNSKAVAATQGSFYSFTPYDAVPRGPLNSWLFSGLVTEPISWPTRNISNVKEEAMPLPIRNEERVETLMPFWDSLQQPFAYDQFLQKKAHETNTCSVPTLSKLFWGSSELAKADSRQQCLAADRPVLNTGMCTELFQFDTAPAAATSAGQGSNSDTKTMAESVAANAAQGSSHNVTSPFAVPVVPRSRRDPFAVPLPPIKPKASAGEERRSNETDPRAENTVREQMHNQDMRHGVSSMVVSVLAGPEEYGDSRRKGSTKGLSRIFVVVLVDNQKYVTYSCMLPFGGPQAHVVAE